jgi:hypothetical protein
LGQLSFYHHLQVGPEKHLLGADDEEKATPKSHRRDSYVVFFDRGCGNLRYPLRKSTSVFLSRRIP